MSEQEPNNLQEKIKLLANQSIQQNDPTGWFETLYNQAQGNEAQIPWAKLTPYPLLQEWLDNNTPVGEGKSALVIGCGLGDDAEALAKYGFSVTGFDISSTAIAWCQQRFPQSQVTYTVADLLALDQTWLGKFDFIFECRTIQALPITVRTEVIKAIASLVAPGGQLLIISRIAENNDEIEGPPWPVSNSQLAQFPQLGLTEIQRDILTEDSENQVQRIRILLEQGKNND